jgi:hypothetical protein
MRLEGLGQLKNPMTSSGIEPVTFRLVAVPQSIKEKKKNYSNAHLFSSSVPPSALKSTPPTHTHTKKAGWEVLGFLTVTTRHCIQ